MNLMFVVIVFEVVIVGQEIKVDRTRPPRALTRSYQKPVVKFSFVTCIALLSLNILICLL